MGTAANVYVVPAIAKRSRLIEVEAGEREAAVTGET